MEETESNQEYYLPPIVRWGYYGYPVSLCYVAISLIWGLVNKGLPSACGSSGNEIRRYLQGGEAVLALVAAIVLTRILARFVVEIVSEDKYLVCKCLWGRQVNLPPEEIVSLSHRKSHLLALGGTLSSLHTRSFGVLLIIGHPDDLEDIDALKCCKPSRDCEGA